jgi:hypothetical protein
MTAVIWRESFLAVQACVPDEWTDEQVLEFAHDARPREDGFQWWLRREGDPALQGAAERVPYAKRLGHIHVMLDA